MNTYNIWNYKDLVSVISEWRKRGSPIPSLAGVSDEIMNNIHSIMNNYTFATVFADELLARSLTTCAPEKALIRLEQFLESMKDITVPDTMNAHLSAVLAQVFASSGALSGRLAAQTGIVRELVRIENPLKSRTDRSWYTERFDKAAGSSPNIYEQQAAVHREHTIQLIRICARNADPSVPIRDINAELTALAEAAIEACLGMAYRELTARTGHETPPHMLTVLGLGKLGGNELNVSSDIDLIYLTGDRTEQYGSYDSTVFHTMLAERLTRLLSEATELGFLYRVDTRLRADGASGPLVRTIQDYLRYLEMRGEAWERQMLLKARPVAGDRELGASFLRSLERFIFPATLMKSPNREIVEIKNRIEARLTAEGSKKTHLKTVPGGVRDIEFVAQCLQLLMGGTNPEVRMTGTLPALEALFGHGALNESEYRTLRDAYILYRRIENALQWRELLPAFSLPEDHNDISEIALYLGYPADDGDPADALEHDIETSLTGVRTVYEAVFSAVEAESFDETVFYAARHPTGDDKTKRFMENLGFTDPQDAALTLSRLVFGEENEIPETTVHPAVAKFAPVLMNALSKVPDPGGTLKRFEQIAESYRARHTLFDILAGNRQFFQLLRAITEGSVFITDILTGDPSLLDWLVEAGEILHSLDSKNLDRELRHIAESGSGDDQFTRSCLAVKNREELRIGARDITGLAGTQETFKELTGTAESIVKAVYTRASGLLRETGVPSRDYSFTIIAAGRLGAGMMDFGSDLDLIFVYREPRKQGGEYTAREHAIGLARRILALLTGGGGPYKVYDVDARLRPEGGNAPLAVSAGEYRRYLDQRASVWERLALIRARHVAGTARFGSEVMKSVESFVFGKPLSKREIERIMEIRKSMIAASQKRHSGSINVKSGAGGITDIDFIAQTYAIHYGTENLALRRRETTALLKALGNTKLMETGDATTLGELHSFLCDVEKALRIGSGRSINTLPSSESETNRVSRLLGFRNSRRFRKRLDDSTALVSELYDRLMTDLSKRAPDDISGK